MNDQIKAEYVDHMGSDLSVVNAARVSFGSASKWEVDEERVETPDNWETDGFTKYNRVLSKRDQGLISFLARGCTSGDWNNLCVSIAEEGFDYSTDLDNGNELEELLNHIRKMPSHWSPFAHTAVTMRFHMPIFIARQIMKHTTGIEYNEISRRYTTENVSFYFPEDWRSKPENNKQGSGDSVVEDMFPTHEKPNHWSYMISPEDAYEIHIQSTEELYRMMIANGIAPEQARMVLPQSMMVQVIVTGNLYALANMYNQRSDSHAQKEAQWLAESIKDVVEPLYPVSWKELTK